MPLSEYIFFFLTSFPTISRDCLLQKGTLCLGLEIKSYLDKKEIVWQVMGCWIKCNGKPGQKYSLTFSVQKADHKCTYAFSENNLTGDVSTQPLILNTFFKYWHWIGRSGVFCIFLSRARNHVYKKRNALPELFHGCLKRKKVKLTLLLKEGMLNQKHTTGYLLYLR